MFDHAFGLGASSCGEVAEEVLWSERLWENNAE